MANLTKEQPLKFTFVPTGQTYTGTDGTTQGTLLFDEAKKIIKVRGVEYGYDTTNVAKDSAKLQAALDSLVNAGLAKSNGDGTYTALQLTNSLVGGTGVNADIDDLITALYAGITGIYNEIHAETTGINARLTAVEPIAAQGVSDAAAAMGEAQSKIKSVSVQSASQDYIQSTTSNYDVTLEATQKLKDAIAAAESAVQTVSLVGTSELLAKTGTGVSGTIDGTKVKVGNSSDTAVQSAYYDNTISYAINKLNGAINALAGGETQGNLADTIALVNQIRDELQAADDGDESALTTIIDALRKLKIQTDPYYGIEADGTKSSTQGALSLQTSLNNLSTFASAQADYYAQSARQDAEGYASGVQSNLAGAYSGLMGTAGTAGYTIQSAKADAAAAMDAAQNAAALASQHAQVVGVTGASVGSTNYVMVSSSTGASGQQVYAVQSTQALNDALQDITAQAAAAKQEADSIISWNVIGAGA